MKRKELFALMREYLLLDIELDNIFDFCSILLEERAKETERDYPYATNTIKRYKDAAYEVFDLQDYVNEIMEGEDE